MVIQRMCENKKIRSSPIQLLYGEEIMPGHAITTCNLCGQRFQLADSLISVRKKRHEEFHKVLGVARNKVRGKVEWL